MIVGLFQIPPLTLSITTNTNIILVNGIFYDIIARNERSLNMKMSLPVIILATSVATPGIAAVGYGASASMATNASAMRANPTNVNYQKYETRSTTRTYSDAGARSTASGAYYQPSNRAQMYRSNAATTNRTTTTRSTVKRKYYLAHPFFQPTEGKFGSMTDLSYNMASYDFRLTAIDPGATWSDSVAKWSMDQFAIKEDLSFGITDKLAVLVMGRYDSTKSKFDWSLPTTPDDEVKDNGLNLYGAGLQFRFTDSAEWIGTLSAYYERQQDVANEFALDLRAGYKIAKSTIYGFGRGWLVNFDDEIYGNGIVGTDVNGIQNSFFIIYDDDAKTTFFIEGGLGVFSVLGEDWTLNLEGVFGHYDWHNQAYVKGAIGWQPNDWFALNLYARTTFYDTADGKSLDVIMPNSIGSEWELVGSAKLDKYREMSFGAQVIFYF